MTRIVAIDTTSEFGSLALVEDGRVVEEILLHSADGFAHILFPQLLRLMERHQWRVGEVTGYAAGAGPGSFTGVRVGLAAAKGLAETAGLKAAGISNLQAMAASGTAELRAPFFDARRGEIYGALYDSKLEAVRPERAQPLPEWLASLPPEAELLTPDAAPFAMALGERPVTLTPRGLAGAIGRLAGTRLQDPVGIDANYVRRSDAELHWKDSR
ncbi:MAG: tRNA (adenosine(37)-N6)-threonylcarbamoyltransferase complex dimerization subunit type 1 TsaB [Bryobacteraceae bacterium]